MIGGLGDRIVTVNRRKFQLVIWAAPLIVGLAMYRLSDKRIGEALGFALATALFVTMVRRPTAALVTLLIFLPVQSFLFGILLGFHIPANTLHVASSFKELLGISILFAGLRELRDGRSKLTRIDKALLLYLGVVTAYLLVPHFFSPSAPLGWTPRLLAWRSDCGYVLLFFGARHAPFSPRSKTVVTRTILVMGFIVAAAGLYERIAPGSFINFELNRAHQQLYLTEVLREPISQATQALHYITFTHPLHVSSIFLSPYDMSDYLLIAVAVAAEGISNNRRAVGRYLVLSVAVGTLFFSRVRADALAGLIILSLVVLPAPRRPTEARLRFVFALIVGAAVIVPSLGGTRFVNAQGGTASNQGHIRELENGISLLSHHPLGLGLAVQPATADRFSNDVGLPTGSVIVDSSVLQVGDELGLQALIPWMAVLILTLAALRRRAREGDDFAAGFGLALLGVVIAGQFHHVFITYPGPWSLWAGVGLALNPQTVRATLPNPADGSPVPAA